MLGSGSGPATLYFNEVVCLEDVVALPCECNMSNALFGQLCFILLLVSLRIQTR